MMGLASGYQQVEYIELPSALGCTSGCLTTIPCDPYGTYVAKIKVGIGKYNYIKCIMCGVKGDNRYLGVHYNSNTSSFMVTYRPDDAGNTGTYSLNPDEIYIIKLTGKKSGITTDVYSESNELLASYSNWRTPQNIDTKISIAGVSGVHSSTSWYGRFYKLEAYDINGNLYAEFVPSYQMPDKKIGFLEIFTGQFFEFLPANENDFNVVVGPKVKNKSN
jgi:hypothetical protein